MQIDYPVNGRLMTFQGEKEADIHRYCAEVIGDAEYAALLELDKKNLTVLDIGACLGTFSAWIYDRAKNIYAVEASAKNFGHLMTFVEVNGLDKIWPYHAAIAGSSGHRMLRENGDCGSYTIVDDREPDVYEWVYATTLARFMEDLEPVDLLKIDVEGAELEIFSATDFGSVAPRIAHIVGEAHCSDVEALLSPHGYEVRVVAGQHNSRLFSARR